MKFFLLLIVSVFSGVSAVHEEHKGLGDSVARRIEQRWLSLQQDIHNKHKLKKIHLKP